MSKQVTVRDSRKILTHLWSWWILVLSLLVVAQSALGKLGASVHDVWNWLLPTFLPIVSLIVSGYCDSRSQKADGSADKLEPRHLYAIALGFSIAYLTTLTVVFLSQPWLEKPILEVIHMTKYWFWGFQGIVVGILAAVFMK